MRLLPLTCKCDSELPCGHIKKGNMISCRTWIIRNEETAQLLRGSSVVPYLEFSWAFLTKQGASEGAPERHGGQHQQPGYTQHCRCDFHVEPLLGALKERQREG